MSLWIPTFFDEIGKMGVTINTSHPWYSKVYVPLLQSIDEDSNHTVGVIINLIFYSLAQAESNNTNDQRSEAFEDFRLEVGKNLRKFLENFNDIEKLSSGIEYK